MARKKRPTQRMTPPPQQAQPGQAQAAAAAMPAPQPLANEKATLAGLIKAIESQRKSSVIVYWLTDNAKISEAVIVPLYDHLQAIGKQESIDVVLFTRGGDTEAPW